MTKLKKQLIPILFIILYFNVNSIANDDQKYIDEMTTRLTESNIEAKSTVDNLRLRKEPDLNSQKITLLTKNDVLKIKEIKKYDFINGKYGRWVKVLTKNNEIGWCFDAFLQTNFDEEKDNIVFTRVVKTIKDDNVEYVIVSHPVSADGGEDGVELYVNKKNFILIRNIQTNTLIQTIVIKDITDTLDIDFDNIFNKKLLKLTFGYDRFYLSYKYFEINSGKITNVFFQYFRNICQQDATCVLLRDIKIEKNTIFLTYDVTEYMGCPECGKGDVIIEYTYNNSFKINQIKSNVKKIDQSDKVEIIQYTKESLNLKLQNSIKTTDNFLF